MSSLSNEKVVHKHQNVMGEQLHVNPMSAWQNGDIPVNTTMITTFMIKIKCNSSESAYSSQNLIYQCQTRNIKWNGLLKNNLIYNA